MFQPIKNLFQAFKVWAFRKYYRFISARGWKGHSSDVHWGALEIPSDAGPIHGRIYNSSAGADKPLIVYFHGGGWVIGDLQTNHPFCLELAQRCDTTVIAIDYRLAPEHPFPAGPDSCLAAIRWIAGHIGDFGPSNGRLVIGGDSAGGNLAAASCLELEEPVRALVAGALILYPAVDHYHAAFPSYTERATGQTLTTSFMFWFWDTYLAGADPASPAVQRAFPLRSDDLGSLPPTLLVTAEFDPLRDEGKAFGDKLREAGVDLQYRHFDNAAHGFACSEGPNEDYQAMMVDVTGWLGRL
jgi:acetyl esterase